MKANVTDKAQEAVPFIETIANTTPRKGMIFLNKAKGVAKKIYDNYDGTKIDPKDFKFADLEQILNYLLETQADDTMLLLSYLFCVDNEEQLNEKVTFVDLLLPLYQLYQNESVRAFFSLLVLVGAKQ